MSRRDTGRDPIRRALPRQLSSAALVAALLAAPLVGAGSAVIPADPASAAEGDAASSAVTLTNRDDALQPDGAPFPDLEVTVSQTKDLVPQGIRVSWTGGKKSTRPDQNQGGSNFLQIAQCWGEDPDHPGHPDRRTCQYGGGRAPGSGRDGTLELDAVSPTDQEYTVDMGGYAFSSIPFVAVNPDGEVDETKAPADRVLNNLTVVDGRPALKPEMVDMSSNQFLSSNTTNEVRWAGAGEDGSGSVPFEVQTATQSTALGCGSPVEKPGGSVVGQSCWLVIIPRPVTDSGNANIIRPGLYWDAWEHHLAVKLDFKPVGVRCEIGEAERQLAGSELVVDAIGSWQPGLCQGEAGVPFVFSQANEADALTRAAGTKPSPLAFTSRPLDMATVAEATDPLAYAPVAISGLAITFAIDREPSQSTQTPPEYLARAGLPFTGMRLTPRLVAKLLTASYLDSVPNGADKSHLGRDTDGDGAVDAWNPRTIVWDPEFRAINDPEWADQVIIGASIADALMSSGRSDSAMRIWEYVLSDPDARAWLGSADDGHGMFVNPWYSTNAGVNPAGVGLALPSESFPKADPIEKPDQTKNTPPGSGPVNLVTWRPFTSGLADGAYRVLRGDGMILGNWEPYSVPPKFGRSERMLFGSQKVIALTSTPAASRYQTVTASLQNPAGEFVAPTEDSLLAAAAAMTPLPAQSAVVGYDFAADAAKAARTAYPLTMPVYAALNPQQSDAGLRATYADLIRYAVEEGQNPGTDVGDLPAGYAPLPDAWAERALAAADAIERGSLTVAVPGGTGSAATSSTGGASASTSSSSGLTQPGAGVGGLGAQPTGTGPAAGDLVGSATPADPDAGPLAVAVPIGVGAGLAVAVAAFVMSQIRRRA